MVAGKLYSPSYHSAYTLLPHLSPIESRPPRFLMPPGLCDKVPPMDFLTFLSIVLPALFNPWSLVVLYGLVRYRKSIEKLADRVTSATFKGFSLVFWRQDLPQPPPLRELTVTDTIPLSGTCRTSPRLLGATLTLHMGGHATGSAGSSATLS